MVDRLTPAPWSGTRRRPAIGDIRRFVTGVNNCALETPTRAQYEEEVIGAGDMFTRSALELSQVRAAHREERRRLVRECEQWTHTPYMVRCFAKEALKLAEEFGWENGVRVASMETPAGRAPSSTEAP